MTTKVAIIPGNGGGDVEDCNWYPWVRDQLDGLPGVKTQLQNMPILGYFDRPWEWKKIKENAGFIVQFGSTDDHAVPFKEQQEVASQLGSELKKYSDRGHFLQFEFPEVIEVIREKLS
ncbi:hypothetical protein CAPTEDRAFT_223996 [Capitella teleta]|uniref:AB hydrolase-1 domain-containing protein n=1 Tax=Capitella teleta TaxID=283909 RepID=R7UWV1_CAPTE|nr:hypothetical protein CAPTEDRAFT_223996 [Capitella teleta]|eukprot:ELU07886.1 hypothetical protein CAPTEDRAFT_223996 [Capitella teleta]